MAGARARAARAGRQARATARRGSSPPPTAIAVAVGAPYGGRQVDRRGARLVLRRRMVLFPSLFGLVAVLGAIEAPIAAIAVAAAAAGLTMAPVSSVLRSIWPTVAGEDGAEDGVCPRRGAPGGDLRRRPAARRRPRDDRPGRRCRRRGGARRCRDVRVLADPARARGRARPRSGTAPASARSPRSACGRSRSSALCLGLGFGAVEIAVPAFAEARGKPGARRGRAGRVLGRIARRRPRRRPAAVERRAAADHPRHVRPHGADGPAARRASRSAP